MKCKKFSYILVLVLMLLIGMNQTYAAESKECNYISTANDFKARVKITWGYNNGFLGLGRTFKTLSDYANVSVEKIGESKFDFNDEHIANWWASGINNWYDQSTKGGAVTFEPYYESEKDANNASDPQCPEYLVFQYCTLYCVWGTDSEATAQAAVQDIKNQGCTGSYASHKHADGTEITVDEYFSEFSYEGLIELDEQGKPTCENDYESIFGSKDDPDSIRYLLETVLQYVRIIVPILIILMGTLDLGKAVLANKEDQIKKAQTDFIKRVIIGVAVFFVPLLVDVVMWLADLVWQGDYIHCDF